MKKRRFDTSALTVEEVTAFMHPSIAKKHYGVVPRPPNYVALSPRSLLDRRPTSKTSSFRQLFAQLSPLEAIEEVEAVPPDVPSPTSTLPPMRSASALAFQSSLSSEVQSQKYRKSSRVQYMANLDLQIPKRTKRKPLTDRQQQQQRIAAVLSAGLSQADEDLMPSPPKRAQTSPDMGRSQNNSNITVIRQAVMQHNAQVNAKIASEMRKSVHPNVSGGADTITDLELEDNASSQGGEQSPRRPNLRIDTMNSSFRSLNLGSDSVPSSPSPTSLSVRSPSNRERRSVFYENIDADEQFNSDYQRLHTVRYLPQMDDSLWHLGHVPRQLFLSKTFAGNLEDCRRACDLSSEFAQKELDQIREQREREEVARKPGKTGEEHASKAPADGDVNGGKRSSISEGSGKSASGAETAKARRNGIIKASKFQAPKKMESTHKLE